MPSDGDARASNKLGTIELRAHQLNNQTLVYHLLNLSALQEVLDKYLSALRSEYCSTNRVIWGSLSYSYHEAKLVKHGYTRVFVLEPRYPLLRLLADITAELPQSGTFDHRWHTTHLQATMDGYLIDPIVDWVNLKGNPLLDPYELEGALYRLAKKPDTIVYASMMLTIDYQSDELDSQELYTKEISEYTIHSDIQELSSRMQSATRSCIDAHNRCNAATEPKEPQEGLEPSEYKESLESNENVQSVEAEGYPEYKESLESNDNVQGVEDEEDQELDESLESNDNVQGVEDEEDQELDESNEYVQGVEAEYQEHQEHEEYGESYDAYKPQRFYPQLEGIDQANQEPSKGYTVSYSLYYVSLTQSK